MAGESCACTEGRSCEPCEERARQEVERLRERASPLNRWAPREDFGETWRCSRRGVPSGDAPVLATPAADADEGADRFAHDGILNTLALKRESAYNADAQQAEVGGSASMDMAQVLTSEIRDRLYSRCIKRRFREGGRNLTCWEWQGAILANGYGMMTIRRHKWTTHRLSWAFANGRPPEKYVLHKCDNRRCINPRHLYEGDHAQNVRDMVERGRVKTPSGSHASHAKLNEAQVARIRQRLKRSVRGDGTRAALAREHGVSPSIITRIADGTLWKDLSPKTPREQPAKRQPRAKLDPEKVREIRRLAKGGLSMREIARRFDISHSNVLLILQRVTWTHVE